MFSLDNIGSDVFLNNYFRVIYFIATCVFIHVFVKIIWSLYLTKYCVTDDELGHLPLPPGTFGYPVIGETIEFILKYDKFYKSRREKYGHVYKTHVLGRPTIRVSGANSLRKILKSEHSYVSSQWPPSIRKVLGPYALSQMDDITQHKERKKLLSKLFQPETLNTYIPVMRKIINQYIDNWCHEGRILGFTECRGLGFNLALQCLAGFDCNTEIASELSGKYEEMIYNMFSLPYEIPGLGLHKALQCKKYLMKKIDDNIECVLRGEVDDKRTISGLDYLMREEDPDDRYKTCESIVELMFASHDTTSSAMCSCLMFIGRNPSILQNIRKEIEAVGSSEQQTVSGLAQFRYIYNVIREVLRVMPPVGAGYRLVLKSFELEGYKIPQGWTVAFGIRDTLETAPVYINPAEFNPDRWDTLPNYDKVTESLEERYNFSAFGGGPRMCVGREFAKLVLRLFLIELCSQCNWTLENPYPSMRCIPVPRPVDKLPTLIERTNSGNVSS